MDGELEYLDGMDVGLGDVLGYLGEMDEELVGFVLGYWTGVDGGLGDILGYRGNVDEEIVGYKDWDRMSGEGDGEELVEW